MLQTGNIKLYCRENGIQFTENEPMSSHTTFRIGGCADLFIKPQRAALPGLIAACKSHGITPFFLGKGSNILVRDEGIRGVVIAMSALEDELSLINDTTIRCTAGTDLAKLCMFALGHCLTGLEFAWGIPGSVGGAVYMNAGAYGSEIGSVIQSATHLDMSGTEHTLEAEELLMGYRTSIYAKDTSLLITAAEFRLTKGEPEQIKASMDIYKNKRRTSQPLELPSAGSTFKRPVGGYASALIDQCGLKGQRVGGAVVSEKHAGFIVNCGSATASDVLELIEQVKQVVLDKTGIALECEVRLV